MSKKDKLNHALTRLEVYCHQQQWDKIPQLVSELRLGFETLLREHKNLLRQNQTLMQESNQQQKAQEKLRQLNSFYLDIYVSSLNAFKKYRQAIELVQGVQSLQELPPLIKNIKRTLGLKTFNLVLSQELFSGLLPSSLQTIPRMALKDQLKKLTDLTNKGTSYLGPPVKKEIIGTLFDLPSQWSKKQGSCFLSILADKYNPAVPLGILLIYDSDSKRFAQDKATDFLEHFCLTLASNLRTLRDHDYLLQHNTLDALTGAHNRTYLQRQARIILNLAERKKIAVTLMFIDLNKFKQINDTLGHRAGDEILVKVSRAIKGMIRKYDCLVRYGGDEFVLLLPGTDLENARQLKKRILEKIARIKPSQGLLPFAISAAIGLTEFSPGQSLETLLENADSQMYREKKKDPSFQREPISKTA